MQEARHYTVEEKTNVNWGLVFFSKRVECIDFSSHNSEETCAEVHPLRSLVSCNWEILAIMVKSTDKSGGFT